MFSDSDIISKYTRAQALQDGQLIDVSKVASEMGFTYPIAITQNLWHSWIEPTPKAKEYPVHSP